MALAEHQSINLLEPVEKVAKQIEQFTRLQKARLLQLVPDLQTIRPDEVEISPQQLELMAYFQKKLDALPERRPRQDDATFIDDITAGEFFVLPESERAQLWDKVHREAERELNSYEREVRSDAIPTR